MKQIVSTIQALKGQGLEPALIILGLGLFLELIAFLQVQNIRRALKTGIVADSVKSLGRGAYDRTKNPVLFKLVFGSSVFAAVFGLCVGLGLIGVAIFLLANS
jgi:hypothetical protein